jgi:hypothetical protein
MTRDEGFRTADVDTGLLDDPKMRALWRLIDRADDVGDGYNADRMARAVVTYLATVLSSWRAGERVIAEDAAPLWDSRPDADVALVTVGLLDEQHRIPAHVWTSWYEPAAERQQNFRASNRLGGLRAKGTRTREEALALLNAPTVPVIVPVTVATDTPARPYRPVLTVPTVPARPNMTADDASKNADDERAGEKAAQDEYIRATGILPAPARMSHPEKAAAILASIRPQLTPPEGTTP